MNGVKNAFSQTPLFHDKEPDLPGDRILLRNCTQHTAYQVAKLRTKKKEDGYLVLAEWLDIAPPDSFFPGCPIFYVLYLTDIGISAISPTNWSKIPSGLTDPPPIELWFDPRE